MARRCILIAILLGGLFAGPALADELVLIANPASGIDRLSRDQAVNLYMGRFKRLPSGITALPLDLAGARQAFYQLLVNKRLAEINSYWARLVFSGRGSPPRRVESVDEMLDIVASNSGAIGYVPHQAVDDRVRVVTLLGSMETARLSP